METLLALIPPVLEGVRMVAQEEADATKFAISDDGIKFIGAGIAMGLIKEDDGVAVLEVEAFVVALEEHAAEGGVGLFEAEVDVAGRIAAEVRNLARDPEVAEEEVGFDQLSQVGRDLSNGIDLHRLQYRAIRGGGASDID